MTIDYLPTRDANKTLVGEEVVRPSAAADDRVGDYRLLRPLGQGGMGAVWEAEQTGTGRRVALKLLSPRLSPTAENIDRFLREGKLAASVSHPRSTFVFGAGQQNGQPYIAMELMPGRTLKDVLDDEGRLPVERAVDYILDAIDGLEAAHALGVIHRDVKPSNCFLDGDGRVKVGDFGLSKSLVSDAELTKTGSFLGTPQFAAPEQVKGGLVDQRTDVYAVGATLFCLLAGRAPFEGDAVSVIAQIVSDSAPRLSSLRPDVREALDRIVARTLEKDPARRFSDLARLRRALAPFATGGVSMADIGRRFAAYMLDSMLVQTATVSVTFGFGITMSIRAAAAGRQDAAGYYSPTFSICMQLLGAGLQILYFALTEGRWGRGPGKRLMGLRVIGPDGDRPGYGRSLLRSFFVPGAVGLLFLAPLVVLLAPSTAVEASPMFFVSRASGVAVLPVVFVLVCLTTMRARNGYRGLHELVSGTRVVRLQPALAGRRQRLPIVLPVARLTGAESFGPFRVAGALGRSGGRSVVQGQDELLGRPVWLYLGPQSTSISDHRRRVARSGRPHWLQGGEHADGHWDAFEAVAGAPLAEIACDPGSAAWHESRHWLLELCEELNSAVADGTLPKALSLDQLWVTRGGRLKLLDAPLRPVASANVDESQILSAHTGPAAQRALALLQEATGLCTRQQILPLHVLAFADELRSRPPTEETLHWAESVLREAVKKPAALGWDDRLGILAVSMGTELSLYMIVVFALPWLLISWLERPIAETAAWLPLALLVPALMGFIFRGGPAFWLTGIHVLRSDGRRAGRWCCGWRSFVAWAPMLVMYFFLGMLLAKMAPSMLESSQPTTSYQFKNEPDTWFLLGGLCGGELLGLGFVVGAVYAVIRPQRGLQDWLSGTWLAPY
jgi:uncharacterized RDD family membrane protein YckC